MVSNFRRRLLSRLQARRREARAEDNYATGPLLDRVVALAVVVSAKPQHDVVRGRCELLYRKLLARYFSKVQGLLCLHPCHLRKQE
jgi:hypothetical protein